jgi:transposase
MAVDSPLLPKPTERARPPIDRREILDAILYVVRTGCQWRQLPIDFPKWKTVYTVFWRWRKAGLWQQLHDTLRQRVRQAVSKKRTPTAAMIGSQSVRSAEGGVPKWLTNRIEGIDLNSGSPAKLFQYLHDTNSPRSRALLQKFDAVADALGLDDKLLDSLLADLGLE